MKIEDTEYELLKDEITTTELVDSVIFSIDKQIDRIDDEINKLKLKKQELQDRKKARKQSLKNLPKEGIELERYCILAGLPSKSPDN